MGKTRRTSKYLLKIYDNQEDPNAYNIQGWDGQLPVWHGQATHKRLLTYLAAYAERLCPVGGNFRITDHLGFIPYPHKAQIVRSQSPFTVVVEWTAETFQVW